MNNACLFEIMGMPEETLKRALPKVSMRMLARLMTAYPRAAGRPLMDIMMQCLSQPTIEFIQEEVSIGIIPSMPEIRLAEAELAKAILDETSHSQPSIEQPRLAA